MAGRTSAGGKRWRRSIRVHLKAETAVVDAVGDVVAQVALAQDWSTTSGGRAREERRSVADGLLMTLPRAVFLKNLRDGDLNHDKCEM
jgi:hypothetical protein